jgi:uncharacterized protein YgiM (DUF1202 family)
MIMVTNPTGANLYAGASDQAAVIGEVKANETLPVFQEESGWYATNWKDNPGWVSAEDVTPTEPIKAGFDPLGALQQRVAAALDAAMNEGVEQANWLRQKYANNQYVEIPGFEVSLGVAPSVTIHFDFK